MLRLASRTVGRNASRSSALVAPQRCAASFGGGGGGGGDTGFADAMFRAFQPGQTSEDAVETVELPAAVQIQIEDAKEEEPTGPFPFDDFPTNLAFDVFESETSKRVDMERVVDGEKIVVTFDVDDSADPLPGLTEPEDGEEAEQGVNFTVRITRGHEKALMFECAAYRQGLFLRDMALAKIDEEGNIADDDAYTGAPLMDMDEVFTNSCLGYLGDRGVDQQLANFIAEYAAYLESQHYQRWLTELRDFLQ